MIYECGEKPIGHAWYNFNPRFYLIALVFVIFEVEIAFTYSVTAYYKSFINYGKVVRWCEEILFDVSMLTARLAYVATFRDQVTMLSNNEEVLETKRLKM